MEVRPFILARLLPAVLGALTLSWIPAAAQTASIPRTLDQLWAGYEEFDKRTPLEPEVLREWEQDGQVCRIIRYQVGVFKGTPSRVAGFYAFSKTGGRLPAILELHGGGQSASLDSVLAWAARGYACLSLNWGGNPMRLGRENWEGPQTDWGRLDATHPPQRNKVNHFAGSLAPDGFTLDDVESPRNSNWYVVLVAARRAISLLERQPEVDAGRIGVRGHSMGGKLTTDLAAIDRRIRTAAPSCGGSGDLVEAGSPFAGGSRALPGAIELACISDNAYLPRLSCPVLWLSPTNDFHGQFDAMTWNWRALPDEGLRFSISPHLDHRHADEHAISELLWFEEHLKGTAFRMPKSPRLGLVLRTENGVPRITVTPDGAQPVGRVHLYYSNDPHTVTRFWRDAGAARVGEVWQGECPVMDPQQPLFVYADVFYPLPDVYRKVALPAGQGPVGDYAISSRMLAVAPSQLLAEGVRSTDQPELMIDDGARGWHDWYVLNQSHPSLWLAGTRKLKDPKWRGPDGAVLSFEIRCFSDNQLVLTFKGNAWGAITPGRPATEHAVVRSLKGSPDWQTVTVGFSDPGSTDPSQPSGLADWKSVTEFTLSPSGMIVREGRREQVTGAAWQGPREIRNLRWITR